MTSRELAKAVRQAHRERYGRATGRLDTEEAAEAVADAEEELGFALPKLVRVVFTYAGPDFVNLEFGVGKYRERFRADGGPDSWPRRMLPVKDLGGEFDWLCVDCTDGAGAVFVYYDNWDSGEPPWPGGFEPVSASFEEFLDGFALGGEFPPGRLDPEDPYGRP